MAVKKSIFFLIYIFYIILAEKKLIQKIVINMALLLHNQS
uniref:Uncharacterized protein n=1 Tax=viral metagenome TaxID=1070528 RepID=A0A6C0CD21_9ZZZZ